MTSKSARKGPSAHTTGKRSRTKNLSLGIHMHEKITEGVKLPGTRRVVPYKSQKIEDYDSELLKELVGRHHEIHEAMDNILELYGVLDSNLRDDIIQIIENRREDNSFSSSKNRINRFIRLIDISSKQIEFINQTEKPIERIQSSIRSWLIRDNLPFLGKIDLQSWQKFLKNEKDYEAKISSIISGYRIPLQKQLEMGNIPSLVMAMFDFVEYLLNFVQNLLKRLEIQNNYSPLIFGIGDIFKHFRKDIIEKYEIYVTSIQQKLDLYEEFLDQDDVATLLLSCQFNSDTEFALDELFRLPTEHVLEYEEFLGDLIRHIILSEHMVIPTECLYKPLSSKPSKIWSFMIDFQQKTKNDPTSARNRSGTASKGSKDPNKVKKKKDSENSAEAEEDSGRKKFPMMRAVTGSREKEEVRKRGGSAASKIKPDTPEKKPTDKSENEQGPSILAAIFGGSTEQSKKETEATQETGKRTNVRREKSAVGEVTVSKAKKKKEEEIITPKISIKDIVNKDIEKADPANVNQCIMNEIQSLWMAYNDLKQQTQKLYRQIGAALFFHLYKKQLKRYDWIRRARAEIISEGDIVVKKKVVNDKESELLNRHFFLFSNFLALAMPAMDLKQLNLKETEGRYYYLKNVWDLQYVTIITAPEPLDDDDKISFDVSVERSLAPKDESVTPTTENMIVTIISEDQFFKVLREQIDQAGTKVFGVDLLKLSKRPETTDCIPNIIIITTQWIKDHCTDVEGIFRKSGALSQIEELKLRIDQGVLASIGSEEDEHVVANIIKLFFRELPVPLIPFTHYSKYMEIGTKIADQQIQTSEILQLLYPHLINLPKPHLKLLIFLLQFLLDMSQFTETTKMDTSNLALVFAGNIIKPESESIDSSMKYNHVNNLFKLMIENVKEIVAMLPQENTVDHSDWLQDVLKFTKTTPIYIEDTEIPPSPSSKNEPQKESSAESNNPVTKPAKRHSLFGAGKVKNEKKV